MELIDTDGQVFTVDLANVDQNTQNVSLYLFEDFVLHLTDTEWEFQLVSNSSRYGSSIPNTNTQNSWTNSNQNMYFVDVDRDPSTSNSSRAELPLPANCTEIIYAGLYWSGRNNLNAANESKKNVKFKKQGQTYINLTADAHYLGGNNQSGIFTGYKDVTAYVRQHGVGNYYVADIDLVEGDGGSTGYFGGWGLIVIYENPTMKWRDIIIFDGYAYVAGNNYYELPLSGFRSAQNGPVNVSMGMMAAEGNRTISGDNFRIRNANNSTWIYLNHINNQTSGNTNSNNFFNSSVLTDGVRFPAYNNNTGLDIVCMELNNTDNSIIGNNATSTRFRYGSDGGGTTDRDTYVIYNIVFAVDAYVPNLEGVNLPYQILTEDEGMLTTPSQIAYRMENLQPNDEITKKLNIYNYGNEDIIHSKIDFQFPNAIRLISANRENAVGSAHIICTTLR